MTQERFGELCRRVCGESGWELLPTGVRVPLADGRQQLVALEFFEYRDEDLVRLSTRIGSVQPLSPVRLAIALSLNAELVHGALAVKDGDLMMTGTLLLGAAGPQEIEASIRYLAETADYYEKTIFERDEH